jgi:hypothetical protein
MKDDWDSRLRLRSESRRHHAHGKRGHGTVHDTVFLLNEMRLFHISRAARAGAFDDVAGIDDRRRAALAGLEADDNVLVEFCFAADG